MFQTISKISSSAFSYSLSFAFSSVRKHLFFFGAPGVGKGTYAEILGKDLKFNKISTGDELRKIIKGQAGDTMDKNLVSQIRNIVSSGKLVSDDIVIDIITEKFKEKESENGVILDGFPRTLSQLEKYEQLYPTHLVFNIFLQQDILIEKLIGRRTCNSCGKAYNICSINRDGYVMSPLLPKEEDTCDACGDKLVIRSDDTREVIEKRMVEYEKKTLPLLQVYKDKGVLVDFEPKKGVKDYKNFFKLVKPLIDAI